MFAAFVETEKEYLEVTGRHLPIYGEMGELCGEIKFGIKRSREYAAGSNGRIGNDFVEIKTISPQKENNVVQVKRSGNFNRLLIVKINSDFKYKGRMISRKDLKKGTGKFARISWDSIKQ